VLQVFSFYILPAISPHGKEWLAGTVNMAHKDDLDMTHQEAK